jgi:hypothetical protein
MSNDLPGFDFSPPPKAEMISSETPKPLNLAEMIKILGSSTKTPDPRSFKVDPSGEMTTTGYTPDEVIQLLKGYRDHMITFSQQMQELQASMLGADAVSYSPDMTDEQIRDRVRNL